MLGGGSKQLATEALPTCCGSHVQQVEEPGPLALAVERRDPDVVREEDEIVLRHLVVVAPELVGDLPLELGPQLAYELLVVGGRGADHGVRYWARR
jgi:hypothetical protein